MCVVIRIGQMEMLGLLCPGNQSYAVFDQEKSPYDLNVLQRFGPDELQGQRRFPKFL